MKQILMIITLLAGTTSAANAQFGSGVVYDPTQGAHAIQQIEQQIQKAEQQIQKAEQIYTTALQTRNTVVEAYNLAHKLSMAPQQLYQHYTTPWTNWNTVVAVNSYGNTPALLQAINSGINSVAGLEAVSLGQAPRYPLYGNLSAPSQQIVAAQGATSDLSVGIMQANLQTLGTMRANSQQRASDIQKLESQTYSSNPAKDQRSTPDAVAEPARREPDCTGRRFAADRRTEAATGRAERSFPRCRYIPAAI